MDNKKLKVLHVLKSSVYSGAENVVITLIKHLNNQFEMAYLASQGEIEDVLKRENITYYLLEQYSRKGIAKVFNTFRPDIIHAHDFTATVICSFIKGDYRLISHLHYDPPWVGRWNLKSILYAYCNRKIQRVLLVSENMFQNMVFAGFFKGKAVVVKNPLDLDCIRRKAEEEISNLSKYDIVFVGRFVEQKDPQRFIHLIAKLKESGCTDVSCLMLGEGILEEECRQLIYSLNLADNIWLAGFQDNPYAFMKFASVLVMTSRWEGFGLVIAEANALGVPVLSTPTAGARELLGDGAWELYDSDEMFIKKSKALLLDDTQYEKYARIAAERARGFDNIDEYLLRISAIYTSEVENR